MFNDIRFIMSFVCLALGVCQFCERDFTKYSMLLDEHLCCSWINIAINQSINHQSIRFERHDKFSLTIRVILLIHLFPSFPSDFMDKL